MRLLIFLTRSRSSADWESTGGLQWRSGNSLGRVGLADRGHVVTFGRAIEFAGLGPFSLALIDIMMPGTDGLERMAKFCEADPVTSHLPAVILTLVEGNEPLIAALVGYCVAKSTDFSVILALIPTQLSLRHVFNPNLRLRQALL